MQAADVPLRHLGDESDPGWADDLRDVALGASDAVWVAAQHLVQSLERRVNRDVGIEMTRCKR